MDIQYVYTKKRKDFNQAINFNDQSSEILCEIIPNYNLLKNFLYKNPVEVGIQNSSDLSENEVNTNRSQIETKVFNHRECGYPKDINIQEHDQINRYKKI